MEEKNKSTDDQKTEDNEIVELKDDDMSTISAGANNTYTGGGVLNVYNVGNIVKEVEN